MSDSCDPVDCSLPGSSAHGIVEASIQEWVAISFSNSSVWPLGHDQHQQEGAPRKRLLLAVRKDPQSSRFGQVQSALSPGKWWQKFNRWVDRAPDTRPKTYCVNCEHPLMETYK